MKEEFAVFVLALMLILSGLLVAVGRGAISEEVLNDTSEEIFTTGSGTQEDPYMIYDVYDLQAMSNNLTAHYALANDIDASETSEWNGGAGFEPIGDWGSEFIGSLDGYNHTINGLHIDRPGTDYLGLFGYVGTDGILKNIGLLDNYVNGWEYDYYYMENIFSDNVGGLAGRIWGDIYNCHVNGTVYGGSCVGGLVGLSSGSIEKSYVMGVVVGDVSVGGLAGSIDNFGFLSSSYSTANVYGDYYPSGTGARIGGLVGTSNGIVNSYSTGNVGGIKYVGGLVGFKDTYGSLTNTYSTGYVTGYEDIGGLVGYSITGGDVSNSFWDIETSGQTESYGGTGKTTAEMKTQNTFTDAGWDFDNIWHMEEEITYPLFQWQPLPGEHTSPIKLYLQVQDSGVGDYKNLSIEPFEVDIQEISTPSIAADSGTYKLGDGWITDAFPEAKNITGTWTFNVSGKLSDLSIDGVLRAEVYSLKKGWLFSALCNENILTTETYHEYNWSYDIPYSIILPPEDRIYIEIWLDVDAASVHTETNQTQNPDFDTGYSNWTFHDWDTEIGSSDGVWYSDAGNPNGTVGVEIARDWFTWVGTVSGYWEQSFDIASIPSTATLELDWRCYNYNLRYGPLTFYAFIDSSSGAPNRNDAIWSNDVYGTTSWASIGPIDVTEVFDNVDTYYLKIAVSAYTKEYDHALGLFDNVQITWETTSGPVFTLGYDHDSTPSSISFYAENYTCPNTFNISLYVDANSEGWNFVSFNINSIDTSLESIISDIEGNYDRLMYYDASEDQWKSYVPDRAAHFNNLQSWDHTMGIWIKMNTDAELTISGHTPTSTDITLYPGWNMVGYPSDTNIIASDTLPAEVTKIGIFNKYAPYNVEYIYDLSTVALVRGQGYWVYNSADYSVIWTVDY